MNHCWHTHTQRLSTTRTHTKAHTNTHTQRRIQLVRTWYDELYGTFSPVYLSSCEQKFHGSVIFCMKKINSAIVGLTNKHMNAVHHDFDFYSRRQLALFPPAGRVLHFVCLSDCLSGCSGCLSVCLSFPVTLSVCMASPHLTSARYRWRCARSRIRRSDKYPLSSSCDVSRKIR